MSLSVRTLAVVCWIVAHWAFSFGVGSQLLSHWLNDRGESDDLIGYAHAFYYLGMAIGSLVAPGLLRYFGFRKCVLGGLIFSGITLAPLPWTEAALAGTRCGSSTVQRRLSASYLSKPWSVMAALPIKRRKSSPALAWRDGRRCAWLLLRRSSLARCRGSVSGSGVRAVRGYPGVAVRFAFAGRARGRR